VTVCIALFRGINVGGKNALPMKALAALLEQLGYRSVRTYIQSGNVVVDAKGSSTAAMRRKMAAAVEATFGFRPAIVVLTAGELDHVVEGNPFPAAVSAPTTLHVTFLEETPPDPDLEALDRLRSNGERFELDGTVFYLHAPAGIGRSKLAARIERALGVAGTARNWRTVLKVRDMAKAIDAGGDAGRA
jgi:uncharacterized protein (DUF1697 family)